TAGGDRPVDPETLWEEDERPARFEGLERPRRAQAREDRSRLAGRRHVLRRGVDEDVGVDGGLGRLVPHGDPRALERELPDAERRQRGEVERGGRGSRLLRNVSSNADETQASGADRVLLRPL